MMVFYRFINALIKLNAVGKIQTCGECGAHTPKWLNLTFKFCS